MSGDDAPRSEPQAIPRAAGPNLQVNVNTERLELTRTLSLTSQKVLKVTFAPTPRIGGTAPPTPLGSLGGPLNSTGGSLSTPLGSSPPQKDGFLVGKVWQRKVLQDLQDQTHFSGTELEVLLNHFSEHQSSEDHLDRETFLKCLGHAFGTSESVLLNHIFTAMDEHSEGFLSFRQFVTALSTVFRGDKDDILSFWFRMYDSDHDGFLSKQDFEAMLNDVNRDALAEIQVYVNAAFETEGEADGEGAGLVQQEDLLLSYDDFRLIMENHDVIPVFVNPHKFAQHKQLPAFRNMSPAEREVILLLGTELQCEQDQILIQENERSATFLFVLGGVVELVRDGMSLGTQTEGSFVGEAALFQDLKQPDEEGNVRFTTAAKVVSRTARVLRMSIQDLYPLVYHEHPGATAILQRLGRVMLERIQQTEDRLQRILATQQPQSQAGMRLSSRDWAAFRNRLTKQWALKYHKIGRKGKLEVVPTKLVGTKEDLSVAYSPGVAEPCISIQQNEKWAYEYTAKGHLVGVITNGTAVLGLGNIGPLASKPVMEGKAVLFKKFADVDAFDIEIQQQDPVKLVDIICALEPTFGGVNLEDIKAPECFYVERECQRRMNIPVFHDDQHGTAIIAGAGLLNALELVNKAIGDIRVVVCGCGAAGYTCATYFVRLGVKKENLLAVDVKGVVYQGREDLADPDNYLANVAVDTPKRTLVEAIDGADVFLGLSAGNLMTPDMLLSMARDPIVFACANPNPEIDPDLAVATRPDVIMCTGRSDFPNQINNVCAFPYMFRGALDCRAKKVNEEMKLAATHAIARLAKVQPQMKRASNSYTDLAANMHPSSSMHANAQLVDDATPFAASGTEAVPQPGSPDKRSSLALRRKSYNLLQAAAEEHGHGSPRHDQSHPDHAPTPTFGRNHIIPKPFDERLLPEVAAAVVQAAMDTGVARLTDINIKEYKRGLIDLSVRISM